MIEEHQARTDNTVRQRVRDPIVVERHAGVDGAGHGPRNAVVGQCVVHGQVVVAGQ
ncbi:hypothetical protein [Streptomyces sp. NPDC057302]|uniref:hypothetical protein n=1 Tax=Streptomyces sp. NPDC057302 TaxID=3346094 RepID=UPI00362A2FB2